MEVIQKTFEWFINQTNTNKIALILLTILFLMYKDRVDFKNEITLIQNDKKQIDSIYTNRLNTLNNINNSFQKKIEECNKERVQDYIRQSEMWEKKFNELFEETDILYQKYQKELNKK